nr:TonB-dependent receptor [Acinetobacter sp. Marseille-Q1620]
MAKLKSLVLMMSSFSTFGIAHAELQESHSDQVLSDQQHIEKLSTITVVASADASQDGLMPDFAGGQVASGGRVGIFGNQKNIDTPFNLTSYTSQYIQERQAKSVGDVLKADPSVRVGRGFGNFQENYYIRGFNLGSDDTAYNGLYSILPRQYIPTELFERVEVLKGASSFLNGAMPGSGGIGGAINLLPKRAGNEPLNRVTVGTDFNGGYISSDISRRFGEDQQFGVRLNTAYHGGDTAVDDEEASLGLASIGLDYRGDHLRLSGDMGYVNNRLTATRPNITLGTGITTIPSTIESSKNFAQKWTYSNEEDVFGSYRAEYDLTDTLTAYAAYGFRHGEEQNSLAGLTVNNAVNGNATFYRFDNARVDMVNTGEIGIRGKVETGLIKHNLVLSASAFQLNTRNAWGMGTDIDSNLYHPVYSDIPNLTYKTKYGTLESPKLGTRTRLRSLAIGDNLSALDEKLIVMLGGRYQTIMQENYDYQNTGNKNAGAYDESKFTPALGITYKITPEVSVYANYIESLAKGLSNATGSVTLKPFVAEQKEIGLKYENERLGASISLFDIDKQRGIQQADRFVDAGKYVHRGIELNTYGQISDSLKVLGGMSWIDAKQKNTGEVKYDGKKEVGVPEFQANLGADWKLPVSQDISLNAQLTYTGSTYASLDNRLKVNDWTTLDLGASYKTQFGQTPTTFNFRINNVFDKDYWSSVGLYDNINSAGNTNNGYLVVGQPRTFTFSAAFDF